MDSCWHESLTERDLEYLRRASGEEEFNGLLPHLDPRVAEVFGEGQDEDPLGRWTSTVSWLRSHGSPSAAHRNPASHVDERGTTPPTRGTLPAQQAGGPGHSEARPIPAQPCQGCQSVHAALVSRVGGGRPPGIARNVRSAQATGPGPIPGRLNRREFPSDTMKVEG